MTIYDPACGSGGMLTESQNFIKDKTYAICKSDMMIKGNNPENIRNGSTLATDEFSGTTFDFMLSNPPYGKSWASELKNIKDGKDIIDSRFIVRLKDYWGNEAEADATPRSSDGQLLFLMEMVSKMKPTSSSPLGSRIASVHNGSSLFTGDAGGGESNIRRYIIENDMLEAIIQLPNNLFYNTGITTYIWILSNNKDQSRKGKVQLIDAGELYKKLQKNLGDKNCEFTPEHIQEIIEIYQSMNEQEKDDEQKLASKVFQSSDFGYYKVNIERPKRLKSQLRDDLIETLRYDKSLIEPITWAYEYFGAVVYEEISCLAQEILEWCEKEDINLNAKQKKSLVSGELWKKHEKYLSVANILKEKIGLDEYDDFNIFKTKVDAVLKEEKIKLSAGEKNQILNAISWYDESAVKVVKKVSKINGEKLDELLEHLACKASELGDFGYFSTGKKDEYVEYETESDLRDSENIPLADDIHRYFLAEVKPHVDEAWINLDSTKIGYEISFNKYFYKHKPLRSIEEVSKDILSLEEQSEGLIKEILGL